MTENTSTCNEVISKNLCLRSIVASPLLPGYPGTTLPMQNSIARVDPVALSIVAKPMGLRVAPKGIGEPEVLLTRCSGKSGEKTLNPECHHDFTYDWIDIDPDTSQMIWYCTKCYITE
jgi:hypothetical protein